MKKIISALSLASYLTIVSPAFATQRNLCPNGQFGNLCTVDLSTLISNLINLIFILAVLVALLYLIYGGFRWLTSTGDKQAVQNAREHIIAAVIGLVIIFLSYFILNLLIGFFVPGFQINSFVLPNL